MCVFLPAALGRTQAPLCCPDPVCRMQTSVHGRGLRIHRTAERGVSAFMLKESVCFQLCGA